MFFVVIITGVVYAKVFDWKETLTGKLFVLLMITIAGAVFRNVLVIWGVISPLDKGAGLQVLIWLSIISLGMFGIIVALLLWEGLRQVFSGSENKLICKLFMLGKKKFDSET